MAAEPSDGEQGTPLAKLDYATRLPESERRSLFVQIVYWLIVLMALMYGGLLVWQVAAALFGR